MSKGLAFADRTAVLFLGIAAGAAIGYAFGAGGDRAPSRPTMPPSGRPVPRTAPPAVETAAPECALPFQQHLLDTIAAGRPVAVGVFGDSFGDGVWSALYRLLPAHEGYRVLKYSQQSTGFTRYASLNLETHAAQQLAADGPIDIAVISFGANDTQGVYAGGHAAALMSPEWQRIIGARVDGFVGMMRARGATVYWVGLPKMREAAFDAEIAGMNDFYVARMKALHVPFIDTKPLTVDAVGDYAPYLPDPLSHETRLMRANDGIHMSMNGYVVITRALATRIKAYVGAARAMAAGGSAAPAPAPVPPPSTSPPLPREPVPTPKPVAVSSPPVRSVGKAKKTEGERPVHRRPDHAGADHTDGDHADVVAAKVARPAPAPKKPARPAKTPEREGDDR